MKRRSLNRQLAVSLAVIIFAILLIGFTGFYVAYEVLVQLRPNLFPANMPDTTGWDITIFILICVVGFLLAILAATYLARRIVRPLHAVAHAAERIAEGDLEARAELASSAHGETADLIANFNVMAERLEKMAADLLTWNAQIAHELRTPLTILRGRLQGGVDGVFQMDQAMLLSLLKQIDGLQRLVEDLRSVSLADSGHLELEISRVDLAAELRDLARAMDLGVTQGGFALTLHLEPGPAVIDITRIRQAVAALIDNALRYADPCQLNLSTRFISGRLEIAVTDCGPGLPAAFADDAFRQFSRGHKAGSRHRSGSGLGLSVVRAIAQAHRGDARYERRNGRHAFIIAVPQ